MYHGGGGPSYTSGPPSFGGRPHYAWQSGDPRNGSVVLLPQRHGAPNSGFMQEQILTSQFEVLHALRDCNARHVFIESFDPAHAEGVNNTLANAPHTPRYAARIQLAASIVAKFQASQFTTEGRWRPNHPGGRLENLLNRAEIELLNMVGGAGIYCLASQGGPAPVTAHPTQSAQEAVQVNAMSDRLYANTQGGRFNASPAEQRFIIQQREAFAANAIANTPLGGETAFLVFGRAHQFTGAFGGPNAPALFRKTHSDPE